MICSIIILIIGVFSIYSYEVYDAHDKKTAETANTEELARLYYYNNRSVTFSDAMELILTYTDNYTYTFCRYDSASGSYTDAVIIGKVDNKRNFLKYTPWYDIVGNAPSIAYTYDVHDTHDYRLYWTESSIKSYLENYMDSKFNATIELGVDRHNVENIVFELRG